MNDQEKRGRVRAALEDAGRGRVTSEPEQVADQRVDQTLRDVEEFVQEHLRRFGEQPDPYSLLQANPSKGKAFFHTDSLTASMEMKIMIWRILLGCEIMRVHFDYELGKKPDFTVVLRAPDGSEEKYRGTGTWDFRVLRHMGAAGVRFGATGAQQGLVLQGFYAMK
jgi:hypothetical protein